MDRAPTPTAIAQLEPPEGVSNALWTALLEDLAHGSNRFARALTDLWREFCLSGGDRARWMTILTTLRQHILPSIGDLETMVRLEDRLHQAEQLLTATERYPEPAGEEWDGHTSAQRRPLYGVPSLPSTDETELTQRIVRRLQQAPDTESVLRIALEELGSLLGAQVAVVRLGTRELLLSAESDSDES